MQSRVSFNRRVGGVQAFNSQKLFFVNVSLTEGGGRAAAAAAGRQGSGAAAGPRGLCPPRTPPRAGLSQDEGRKTTFNFQGANTSFNGEARVVNGTLNRSKNKP